MTFPSKAMSKISGSTLTQLLSMVKHIDHFSRSAYVEIRRISSIQLMCSFVLSRLDCCNCLFTDINCDQMYRLQKVQNHAAKFFCKSRHEHVKPLLKALQWLSVIDRFIFTIATLVFRCFLLLSFLLLFYLFFLWYPATISVTVFLCIHSLSHTPFQFR